MKAVEFPEHNIVFTHPDCSDLPAYANTQINPPMLVVCFELDEKELETIQDTKQIWFTFWLPFCPPMCPEVGFPETLKALQPDEWAETLDENTMEETGGQKDAMPDDDR